MKRSDKEAFVAEFRDRVESAGAIYLTDFTGLDVKAMTTLRRNLKRAGGEYVVVKNRLVQRALAELDVPDFSEYLLGPTGVVFGSTDVVEAAKAVADFAKEHGDRPVFKVGLVESELLDAGEVNRLAQLPPRDQLLSELAGALAGPMSGLASALQAKLQEAVGLLEALQQERS